MKRRKRNESVSWFPGVDPEAAMSADAALQDATHDLLRALLAAFPQLDPAALSGVVGKAEKAIASGLVDLLAPADVPPADDTQFADPAGDSNDEFPPEESLARRVLRQCEAVNYKDPNYLAFIWDQGYSKSLYSIKHSIEAFDDALNDKERLRRSKMALYVGNALSEIDKAVKEVS